MNNQTALNTGIALALTVCAICLVMLTHAHFTDRDAAHKAAVTARNQAAYAQSMADRQAEIDRLEAMLFN